MSNMFAPNENVVALGNALVHYHHNAYQGRVCRTLPNIGIDTMEMPDETINLRFNKGWLVVDAPREIPDGVSTDEELYAVRETRVYHDLRLESRKIQKKALAERFAYACARYIDLMAQGELGEQEPHYYVDHWDKAVKLATLNGSNAYEALQIKLYRALEQSKEFTISIEPEAIHFRVHANPLFNVTVHYRDGVKK